MSYYSEGGAEQDKFDVVVVGAGAAGLRTAIAALEASAKIAVVCKSRSAKRTR